MSITDNSLSLAGEGIYQRQMSSFRRTRAAILEGAKKVVALNGIAQLSMVDIADISEVSRATLYNHFRDKNSVLQALVESEVSRVLTLAASEPTFPEALLTISTEISTDKALARLRESDPSSLARFCSNLSDPLWGRAKSELAAISGVDSKNERIELVILWLVGQVFRPLEASEAAAQVILMTGNPSH